MKIVVIGAVAAGTSAAAKARRNSEDSEIVIYEKDRYISYTGCGMPYYLGDMVKDASVLTPRDPEYFKNKYNVTIKILHEVLSIDPGTKSLEIKNLLTGEIFKDNYDKLVIATGAKAVIPPVRGADSPHVFSLRNMNDMNGIKEFIRASSPKNAVIIGSGYIGLEVCENLKGIGIDVTIVEKLTQVTPGFDSDMAIYIYNHLLKNGIKVLTGTTVMEISGSSVKLSDGDEIKADIVIISAGIFPETELARKAGVATGIAGAIRVNKKMQTNIEDIYACGDCAENYHLITGKPVYRPLGSTANKTGRITGENISGGDMEFRGILGTGIFKVFDIAAGQTGLSEKEAIDNGFEVVTCHIMKPAKAEYLGGRQLVIKAVASKTDGRLLGVQIIGPEGVDKRIDVFATAITFGAKAQDLFHLDLAYAPPFSTTKDPVMYTGMILENEISKGRPLIKAQELDALMKSGERYILIDVRSETQYGKDHIANAKNIPLAQIREAADGLEHDITVIVYCNRGTSGNAAQNILLNKGFKKVFNLSGGFRQYRKMI
ncbi:MAG: FAD-dependent oxidoreductase [Saccharofermentanales bacterium]